MIPLKKVTRLGKGNSGKETRRNLESRNEEWLRKRYQHRDIKRFKEMEREAGSERSKIKTVKKERMKIRENIQEDRVYV